MIGIAQAAGLGAAALLFAALLWSWLRPARRIWPPHSPSPAVKVTAWGLTVAVFVSAFLVGVGDWNTIGLPAWLRWSVGGGMIVAGNAVVWAGVRAIGMDATGGDATKLGTGGFYRYSRNPQYIADMAILVGWQLLCASWLSIPVVLSGIAVLAFAPLPEEAWLEAQYGEDYRSYKARVRRYL